MDGAGRTTIAAAARGSAFAALGWLVVAGLVLPFSIAFGAGLTGLDSSLPEYVFAGIIVLAGATLAGAAFGRRLGLLAGAPDLRRMAWAGALGFGPAVIAAGILLGLAEPVALRATQGAGLSIHLLFWLLFVPAVFVVVAVTGLAFGSALRSRSLGAELALKAGLAAATNFFVAALIQHLLGRRVGGPNAAATATMVTVTLVGVVLAAPAAGAAMGGICRRHLASRARP